IQKCGVIATGVSPELDELRRISTSSREYLTDLQARLSAETGIPSLKVAYNNVFGYFIEVRNTHKDKVPPDWIRKQTMTAAERYVTPELKEYEEKIVGADQRIAVLEAELYSALIAELNAHLGTVQADAARLAEVDVLHTFARNAVDYSYCRPDVNDSDILDIVDGRHPVIERLMPDGDSYVSNSVHLDPAGQQIIIVTGPNMAGKSALLRQTALIVLLAQCGSFVPATKASVGVVDKIFTRVGANDNLSQGESTFMVEMTEAANILNNVTPRSLVLFDELGRGTSTYDGISLAWAIVEYLHDCARARAKTLFATHYHELNDMERKYDRIKNFNVSVREAAGKVIFLRKLVPGGSEHSFGIHVAKLAGMPREVVSRANEILAQLERERDGDPD
ncbi:MAG: DNA mismatch repair protein MutS, partial [Bacteroidales bacterium]|nr:DNA mismatch repair protein MutS [Bacteroidales bacterium]